jgi:predicted transcriptional regulator of viral defense system
MSEQKDSEQEKSSEDLAREDLVRKGVLRDEAIKHISEVLEKKGLLVEVLAGKFPVLTIDRGAAFVVMLFEPSIHLGNGDAMRKAPLF